MTEMTDEQRSQLGARVRQARMARFDSKLDAYRAAGINSQTWDRIESGLSVKERSLVASIKLLWPDTGGDWRQVPGMSEDSEAGAEVPSQSSSLEARVVQLELRIERLELLGRPGIHTERSDIGRIRALESELTALRENSDADDLVSDGGATMEPIAAQERDVQKEFDESND